MGSRCENLTKGWAEEIRKVRKSHLYLRGRAVMNG